MSANELSSEPVELIVDEEFADSRLDWFLAQQFPGFSRVQLRRAIDADGVRVNGKKTKASSHVHAGQRVSVLLPDIPQEGPQAEDIPLDVLFEDCQIAAINKPPGMVVHPAKGHWSGTLASALRYHFEHLSSLGGPIRPGIVHRLDRDTSGVIVVAKTDEAHRQLALQFEQRTVDKEYFAIVAGRPDRDRDTIDQPIGPHPHTREKMAIRPSASASREARSFYEVVERFDGFATVRISPKTGRTHQIRVHLAHIGCPVLCDKQYGGRSLITLGELSRDADLQEPLLSRQALHAARIAFVHPTTGEPLEFVAPVPDDLERVIAALRQFRAL